jgi:hypothetical protein
MAEYYEWLTPEHNNLGLRKTHAFFRNIDDSYFESSSVSIEFLEDLSAIRHSKKITSIDILPSKYTEIKKRYWSKIEDKNTSTFTDLKHIVSDWIRSNKA